MEHNQPDKELVSAHNLTEKPSIELETVEKAMRGDKEAFSALFMQTYRSMYLVVRRFLERDEDIYDALQNGYIKAYKYLSRLQAPEAFVSWLKKTMENAARDIRAAVTGPETAQEDMAAFADELTAEELTASERRADIQEVLSRLDSRQAEVLTLYYYDGMKLSEIAKLLGEPPSTVRSRFAQAKKSLVEQLKVKGIDKSLYSGSVSAMIAVSLRSLIGTDVLSAATAQQMLDDILGGRQGRLGAAAYKMLEAQRNRAILRAVSLLMALTVAFSCVTVALLNGFPWKWLSSLPAAAQSDGPADRPQPSGVPGWSLPPASSDNKGHTAAGSTTAGGAALPTASGGTTAPGRTTSDASNSPGPGTTSPPSSGPGTTKPSSSSASAPPTTAPPAVFVPDYRPGKANTAMRNPTWRAALYNHGSPYLDWQDEWVYNFQGGSSGGYKFRRDGTGDKIPIQVPGDGMFAPMVWGDWVYYVQSNYTALKRVRTDGAVVETLVEVSDKREITGFIRQGDRLLYSVAWVDPFGVVQFEYWAYTPATDQDERLPVSGNFNLMCIPVGDWFFNPFNFCAYSFEHGEISIVLLRTETEGSVAGEDWGDIRQQGYFPTYILGDKLYTPTGHCIDFSGERPRVYQAVSFSGSSIKTGTAFQVEFIDQATGRLAVTLYDESDIYPVSMRWYSEKSGWGEALPKALMRHSKYQTYQTSGDGRVFTTREDDVWFSCKMDGSGYIDYVF